MGDLYTFLPAKPGVGCSTITMSTSCALAEEIGARTLLLDCDLAAGTIKFLLKLGSSSSIVDAMGHALNLDEGLWTHMVGQWDKLDVLHAGELAPPPSIDLNSLRAVLAIARSQYQVICADLASSMDEFTIDLMRQSRKIFVVTTPEVVPLYMAGQRIHALKSLGLDDKVNLLLNRKSGRRGDIADEDVVRATGMPIAFSFCNDYCDVGTSIVKGSPVSNDCKLGQSILNLARSVAPGTSSKEPSQPRRFLEFFHVPKVPEADEVYHD
jgi:pilus assembly protein CpaE